LGNNIDKFQRDYPGTIPAFRCDRYLALCDIQASNGYYLLHTEKLRVLAVGGWSKRFAPPSLLEFIVFNVLKQGIRAVVKDIKAHVSSRGCIFDFNPSLENAKNGVLTGHICEDCSAAMNRVRPALTLELKGILGGRWLGDPKDPYSAHQELARLGFPVFQASGVQESWFRRVYDPALKKIGEEMARMFVLFLVLLAAIILGVNLPKF
jgi:hypothetical protein